MGREERYETQNWENLKNKRESPMKPIQEQLNVGLWFHRLGWNHSLIFKSEFEQDHGAWQQSPEREEWLPGRKNLIINLLFEASFALADAATHHGSVHVMPTYNAVRRRGLLTGYAFCGSHLWDGTTPTPLQPGSSMVFGGWCFRGLHWSMSCCCWLCPCWGFYCFTLSFP